MEHFPLGVGFPRRLVAHAVRRGPEVMAMRKSRIHLVINSDITGHLAAALRTENGRGFLLAVWLPDSSVRNHNFPHMMYGALGTNCWRLF